MAHRPTEPSTSGRTTLYVAIGTTMLFAILTALVVAKQTAVIDRNLILSLRALASPWLTTVLLAVTFTSGWLAPPAALFFAAMLYRRSGLRAASYYAGACITALILDAVLKHVVNRARPHGVSPRLTAAGGYAYPSADAMLAVVIFGLGTLMLSWTIRSRSTRSAAVCIAALFVVAAAVARVYLGAHWPTDVLGGVLAGAACAALSIMALRRSEISAAPVVSAPPRSTAEGT